MRVKEDASEPSSGFLPVMVDLILSNQPKDERCGVMAMPREGVRMCIAGREGVKMWSARREAMDLDAVSGEPAAARRGGVSCWGFIAATGRRIRWASKNAKTAQYAHLGLLTAQVMLKMFSSAKKLIFTLY
jgi:hypothetical protein